MLKKYILKLLVINLLAFISSMNLIAVKSKTSSRTDVKYCTNKKKEIDGQSACDPQFSQYYDYFGVYKTLNTNFKILAETSKKLNDAIKDCGQWLNADADITKMPSTCLEQVKEIPSYVKDLADNQKKGLVDILLQNSDCLDDNELKTLKNLKMRKITLVEDYEVYENFPLEMINEILTKMKNTLDYWLQKCKNESLREQLEAQDTLQKRSMQMQLETQQCDRDSAEFKEDKKKYYKEHPACAAQDQYNEQASSGETFQYANLALFGVMALPVLKEMWQAISKGPSAMKAVWQAYKLKPITTGVSIALKDIQLSKGTIQALTSGLKELKELGALKTDFGPALKELGNALTVIREESIQIKAAEKVAEFLKSGGKTEKELMAALKEISVVGKEAEAILKEARALKAIKV